MEMMTLIALLGGFGAGLYIGAHWENKRLKYWLADQQARRRGW